MPGRTSAVRLAGQCSSPSALKTRTGSLCAMPRGAASSGWMWSERRALAQLAERGRDRLLGGRRDQRQRELRRSPDRAGSRTGPRGRRRRCSSREEMDLPVGRQREHVDELDRRAVVRRRRRRRARAARRRRRRACARDPQQRLGLVFGRADAQPLGQLREDVRVGARLAVRLDHRPHELQGDRPVALGDVVVLEERRRRQHHVRVARGVGEDLLEDDREEIRRAPAPAARDSDPGAVASGLQL